MSMSLPTTFVTGKELTLILACYCLGCFTAGYYWVRWRTGHDIRQQGSGSVGARNVGRTLGPSGFVVTFLLDIGKGALAAGLALHFGLSPSAVVAALVAVVAGHNWPMQLRFHGGKGIATSLGALLAYDRFLVLILVGLFLPVLALLRNFTLSGLLAFALSPLVVFLCGLENVEVAAVSLLAILVLVSHRKNIREEFARILPPRPVKQTQADRRRDLDHEL
jgi:acyl phosphate:glycerol-3-phosphate acyltransferase